MTCLRLKPHLWEAKDRMLEAKESADAAKAASDVGLICGAMGNCSACGGAYRRYCIELDSRLAGDYPIARVFQDFARCFPALPPAAETADSCSVRDNLLEDNLGIACHLLVSHGFAASFVDCAEVDCNPAMLGDAALFV